MPTLAWAWFCAAVEDMPTRAWAWHLRMKHFRCPPWPTVRDRLTGCSSSERSATMAAKRSGSRRKASASTRSRDKVGSDPGARVAGKGDFGIPADQAIRPIEEAGRGKGPDQGTGPTRSEEH